MDCLAGSVGNIGRKGADEALDTKKQSNACQHDRACCGGDMAGYATPPMIAPKETCKGKQKNRQDNLKTDDGELRGKIVPPDSPDEPIEVFAWEGEERFENAEVADFIGIDGGHG